MNKVTWRPSFLYTRHAFGHSQRYETVWFEIALAVVSTQTCSDKPQPPSVRTQSSPPCTWKGRGRPLREGSMASAPLYHMYTMSIANAQSKPPLGSTMNEVKFEPNGQMSGFIDVSPHRALPVHTALRQCISPSSHYSFRLDRQFWCRLHQGLTM